MESYFLTDTGRVREHNEDSVTILKNINDEYLLAVADGMGGHKAGEVASAITINHLTENFNKIDSIGDKASAVNWIRKEAEDINNEIDWVRIAEISEGVKPRTHKKEYLDSLAVYRKISDKMIDYDTFLFHGSAVCVDNEAYIFTAKSGTGKSTHARLWRELLGDRVVMVNDDKPLIRIMDDQALVYGTPYDGKHHLSSNISVHVKAVCILEQATDNHIKEISMYEAYPMFIQQTYKPSKPDRMKKAMELIGQFLDRIKVYKLECNMNIEAAEMSYKAMKGE